MVKEKRNETFSPSPENAPQPSPHGYRENIAEKK
jgi:hypothetical protein